mmetsp:Transcript_29822/g.41220  ORF Transcript_29822/g.41220 Transcript_29822/m.41220 type:complete len:2214 (+) Transcript_29822:130-6771(+)|eukprot:CAMPEP_0196589770 /NCGR_PEP_ID=MMETSP1081-20130531/64558_1 /TAXON_ID=36882 /ORGANISM="Pyramimonas amylifera, Strain CCMP720" /LENGTH=2213 /DNA_ID=CAMNT_0041912665 /DNA_START=130 /DNA_END=6771 /DNA_ORIENTATION=-
MEAQALSTGRVLAAKHRSFPNNGGQQTKKGGHLSSRAAIGNATTGQLIHVSGSKRKDKLAASRSNEIVAQANPLQVKAVSVDAKPVETPVGDDPVANYVREKGGRRAIRKILVANNGMAATKCILSMRQWAYLTLGDETLLRFVVMATPEDLNANAEYIRLSDDFIEVPGGKNSNNYANVNLIVSIAVREGVDAVWPGWGHASENPNLPRSLLAEGIQFIGPTANVMSVLGDKIAANILAQTAKVPSIPWSGDGLEASLTTEGTIPDDIFRKATVNSAEEAVETGRRVGYPIMVKASEGGGGKGIRKCTTEEELEVAYSQVVAEVPGSPVFMMQLCSEARHLEVQIVGDEHGNAVAFNGRDCSTQRRFQKIFEEGPPTIADPAVFKQMELSAQRLTQNIGYIGAGTVEYLYNAATKKYFFLELNPRLQVEHPVTEGISGVNMPATQLQVAMGIPLHRMPDVRRFYGRDVDETSPINFLTEEYVLPGKHVIAARITAENPDEGFKPTSGRIERIRFQSSPTVWGYFSVGANGAVHEFADSQFGHLFASGATREEARKALVIALKELLVRGEIRTAVEYLVQLLSTEAFIDNTIDTSWLDKLIAEKGLSGTTEPHLIVASAALYRANAIFQENEAAVEEALGKGQQPNRALLVSARDTEVEVTYESIKYTFRAVKLSPDTVRLTISVGKEVKGEFTSRMREQSDGTLLATFAGATRRLSAHEEPLGLRLELDGKNILIPTQFDPSELRSDVNGKVVRFLHEDGAEVEAGKPFMEVEAMKMVMPLLTTESGVIKHYVSPGAMIEAGELLASLKLRDPSRVKKILPFTGDFNINDEEKTVDIPETSILEDYRETVAQLRLILAGYAAPVESTVQKLLSQLSDQRLFEEYMKEAVLQVGTAAMPASLLKQIQRGEIRHGQELQQALAGLKEFSLKGLAAVGKPSPLAPLEAVAEQYKEGRWGKSLLTFTDIMSEYVATEQFFAGKAFDSAAKSVTRKSDNLQQARNVILSHAQLKQRTLLASSIISQLSTLPQRCDVSDYIPFTREFTAMLNKISSLQGRDYGSLALLAATARDERKGRPFEQRLGELRGALLGKVSLLQIWDGKGMDTSLDALAVSPTLGVDLLPSLFMDKKSEVSNRALEVFVRRVYRAHHVEVLTIEQPPANSTLGEIAEFKFRFRDSEPSEAPLRAGMLVVVPTLKDLDTNFPAIIKKYQATIDACPELPAVSPPVNALHFAVMETADAETVQGLEPGIQKYADQLRSMGVRMVNVIACQGARPPLYYTFTECEGYKEDPVRRNMRPTFTHVLELPRLSNYDLTRFPTINRDLHIYLGVAKGVKAQRVGSQRLFLRRISHSPDFLQGGAERMLEKALDAVELALRDPLVQPTCPTSLFISVMPRLMDGGPLKGVVGQVESILSDFIAKNSTRLLSARVDEIELKIRAAESDFPTHPTPMRVVAASKTGKWLKINSYKEFPDPVTGMAMYFCTLDNSDRCYLEPYTISSDVELKRASARRIGTTYAYDFLGLMEKTLITTWDSYLSDRPGLKKPATLFNSRELGVGPDGTVRTIERTVGTNDVGMVGWECELFTPEAPEGRTIVVIANDVTVKSGSFGVQEDDFFAAVSRYAAENGLPRIYIACNSGARIGLVEELKPLIQVAWTNESNPSLGFKYLYLSDADYQGLAEGTVKASQLVDNGEVRWVVSDIIGTTHGIGVENLRGSGMIAGETSRAYTETFTLSYVTGRSVGIGAYLCRLGQRTIQMQNGPMILTGYSALNKLLGRPVYTSQDQLGGPQIMIPNGVSHLLVEDDQEGTAAMLTWLSFVPHKIGQLPPQIVNIDPVDRDVEFTPSKTPYDPRHMLAGVEGPAEGGWKSGLFDKDSFVETLAGWGKTVVVGRARLGGVPVGIVAVETRSVEQFVPADPANPNSSEVVLPQAGQVWFPDSAFKTATAIRDFNNGEQLPLFIFANWRGFSGGTRDMYNEVLKFGAMIVDSLREYRQPVFVYIPPGGELRGGAWVVVDPTINLEKMEMYADVDSRGGILEPPGICEVKFRRGDQIKTMHRLDPTLKELDQDPTANAVAITAREDALLPVYLQLAHEFADLHDRAGRMEAKGVIRRALQWKDTRRFFHDRLLRRLEEDKLRGELRSIDSELSHDELTAKLSAMAGDKYEEDLDFLKWLESGSDAIDACKDSMEKAAVTKSVEKLLSHLDPAVREAVMAKLNQ